jgi:hypothetical protein
VWIAGHWERERAEQAPPFVVETPPPSTPPPPSTTPPSNPNAIVQLTVGENHTCTLVASSRSAAPERCPAVPLSRRQDWRLRDPRGLPLDQVRAIRDEIRGLVTELIHDRGWAREPRPRP